MRRARSGFTLVELVIVVALVAVFASTTVFLMRRSADVLTVEGAAHVLKAQIERAQALSSIAGSRVGTTRLVLGAACPQVVGEPQLWIEVDRIANRMTVPVSIALTGASDEAIVECAVFDLAARSRNLAAFEDVPTRIFAFTSDGRVVQPGGLNRSVFLSVRHQGASARKFGWRILASGVVCAATALDQNTCDEDA